jgi:hypothetical protein
VRHSKDLGRALWTVQVLLALFFAFGSGAPKLLLPLESLPMPIPLPGSFILFIGTCEVLGAIGLILPGVLRIRPGVTPVAAAALVALTLCATVYQLAAAQVGNALFALFIGLLAAFVAYGRWRLVPLGAARRTPLLEAAG